MFDRIKLQLGRLVTMDMLLKGLARVKSLMTLRMQVLGLGK
jgi:hypothetical protein